MKDKSHFKSLLKFYISGLDRLDKQELQRVDMKLFFSFVSFSSASVSSHDGDKKNVTFTLQKKIKVLHCTSSSPESSLNIRIGKCSRRCVTSTIKWS